MQQDIDEEMTKASVAATKIQANFRGYRIRKQLKESKKDTNLPAADAIRRECGQRQQEYSKGRREFSIPKNASCTERVSLEEKSATKIQAGVRGFLVRKRQEMARMAATTIQAGFRGFRTRKQLKESEQ
ncbi:PREDICTED: neuromodulin [Dufourea novaeangliae]|uniref:neuromodulin n=1 Tax=Dufourea novaeangliae TaxID=178035 RepID=UPI0007676E85|nr:PREDICTED: neuromodulin [Dufourea novaeangliae]